MSFDGKWSKLSKEDQVAAKKKYGSRKAWQDAKARSQGYQNKEERTKDIKHISDSESKANSMDGAIRNKNGDIVGYSGAAARQRNAEIQKNREMAAKQQTKQDNRVEKLASNARANGGKMGEKWNKMTQNMSTKDRNELRSQVFNKNKQHKQEAAQDYRQSRVEQRAAMDKAGRRGVYEYQSAQKIHKDNIGKYSNMPDDKDNTKEKNAIIRTFQDSGMDYNHADVLRHMKGGAENKQFTDLYKDYGGYQNWYNNHSIYSGENAQAKDHLTNVNSRVGGEEAESDYKLNLGNWTGSKDIMERGEVLRQGQAMQQAGQNYRTSEDFANRFGKYDFAKAYKNR